MVVLPMEPSEDREVRAFLAQQLLDFNPYAPQQSAWALFRSARERFGDARLLDVEYWEH
jgi:hypothetical protein